MMGIVEGRARRAMGAARMKNKKAVFLALAAMVAMTVVVAPTPTGAAPGSAVDETEVPHYFGPYPNWANSPLTQPDATVTIAGASVSATAVGNPLTARASATDGAPTVFGVLQGASSTLPTGSLTSFSTWNQPGSAGNVFHAYVLRPTGAPGEYTIVFDSGALTVPTPANPAGEVSTFPVSPFTTQSGDLIGWYGQGIPLDIGSGTDVIAYPGPTSAPVANDVATLGSGSFPIYPQARTYSISAGVTPPAVGPGSGATAEATVGANGAVTGLTITNPGSGYSSANVSITGAGIGATATADVQPSGAVTSVAVSAGGGGYRAPSVAISGGGATTDASAHVAGGVDKVLITTQGQGYKFPTVDFDMPDDPNGVQATGHATCAAPHEDCNLTTDAGFLTVTGVVVDFAGSGYATAPVAVIRDGTQFEPINHVDPFTAAATTSTLTIHSVVVDSYGVGYTSAPTVTFSDTGTGSGASATASTDYGAVIGLNLVTAGSGYITPGGIKKFQDTLPGLGAANKNNLGQYIPVAVPDTSTFPGTDYYVIAVVQHRERMSSSLPATGTLLREYVQLSTSKVPGNAVPLETALLDGTTIPTMMPDGLGGSKRALGVDDPHYLGPTIIAKKDRAVRIVFYNLLPKGAEGDLFLPTDSSMMGSGMGPMGMPSTDPVDEGTVTDLVRNPECTQTPKPDTCFKDDRALLHLHGGTTPWISDGTPHQWITPANETTPWPQGVSVGNVPDMAPVAGVPNCTTDRDGCQTFYYTNEQSARLMFYHDHAWGITRLNVYAGEAAGYIITDDTEQKLFGPSGTYSDMGEGIPLVIQDRTFVPSAAQLAGQDPTWDSSRWGGMGSLWYHHVYMPAQNPGDPSGMSSYGRWMYGPWFWPPFTPEHPPIDNPYYNMDPGADPPFSAPLATPCNLDEPSTWQYQVSPFCEPPQIPGTPNISTGMEQFNDTPIVNGTAYPTTNLEPKAYRFRMLNAANDRFWNLSWYVADNNGTPNDPSDDILTEVALKDSEVAAAQTDINIIPTPDTTRSPAGPDWIQIGNDGGFLPAPAVVPAQPTTYITDPTRFDIGNVDRHSMLLAPAERSDVIVDFSKYPGKTLILYNDAPAAFPARVATYDYYTGAPDTGAGVVLPGYGPNTRTVMQVKIGTGPSAGTFNRTALSNLFKHHADGSGVFESGQHPIIVGQAAYNSAYGTSFAASGDCTNPAGTNKCDGFARINQQGRDLFRFDNLKHSNPQLAIPLEPKAIHDEMNSASFDLFGRMTANLGLEVVPATPTGQNMLLYPYVAPPTEIIDGTDLPKGDVNVQAISDGSDGTQIWKITHNGVDTHPIHFHLYDVQVLNRVTWDNIIIPPEASELGWKDTVRISPLEDTLIALRPIIPTLPFEIPNSIRPLDPMMAVGENIGGATQIVDPDGNITTLKNALVNFGWEYVYHCHILSHEEMDMMRPVALALPPTPAGGLVRTVVGNRNQVAWNDNSIAETSYILQRSADGITWTNVGTSDSPLTQPNTKGAVRSLSDTGASRTTALLYRVVARNTVGYGGAYPAVDADSLSSTIGVNLPTAAPAAPTQLTATLQSGPQVRLRWRDNAVNEGGFVVERSTTGLPGSFMQIAVAPASSSTGNTTFTDTTIATGTPYWYRVAAVNLFGGVTTRSAYSNTVTTNASPAVPAAPSNLVAANAANQGRKRSVGLTWTDNSTNETGFTIQRSTNPAFTTGLKTTTVATNALSTTLTGLSRATTYFVRIRANNNVGSSAWSNATPFPIITNP